MSRVNQQRPPHPLPLSPLRGARGAKPRDRRGYTIILVLGLIAMTMGVSYAMVRSQTSSGKMLLNRSLQTEAKEAALTGLSAAMRRISQTSWGGVGTSVTGKITGSASYTIAFAAGDASLATSDTNYPYRVTITSTGYAVDPTASTVTTAYAASAVLQLTPQKLASNPSPWNTMLSYVFYQTNADNITVQLPLQISGTMRFQGGLTSFMSSYPYPSQASNRYISDLNSMRVSGFGDNRPFTGPILLPNSATTGTVRNQLSNNLGITTTNTSAVTTSNWAFPGTVTSYRLFTGGPSYDIPSLPSTVSGTSLGYDARTNPAGILFRNGDVTIGSNTTIVGTVICTGNVIISGTTVSMQPVSLAAISGTSATPQFPVIVANQQVRIVGGSSSVVRGTVAAFDKFVSLAGTQNTTFDMDGNLIARSIDVQARDEFNVGTTMWSNIWNAFGAQTAVSYLPVYTQLLGMNYTPLLTISPPTGSVTRQWFTTNTPIYSVADGYAGLIWSVVRIVD